MLIVCGALVNGPYALITTAVSADLVRVMGLAAFLAVFQLLSRKAGSLLCAFFLLLPQWKLCDSSFCPHASPLSVYLVEKFAHESHKNATSLHTLSLPIRHMEIASSCGAEAVLPPPSSLPREPMSPSKETQEPCPPSRPSSMARDL